MTDEKLSPPWSRRSSVSSAFFDEQEFNFLARRRLQSPCESLSSEQPTQIPTVQRPGLIRTLLRESCGIVLVEHWLLVKDVALCLWRYVQRVTSRMDNCRVATFGLLQALA